MEVKTATIDDARLEEIAAGLVPRLNRAVDWIAKMEDRRTKAQPLVMIGPKPCIDSKLDFMARPGKEYPVLISAKYSKKNPRQFIKQKALCLRCTIREECLVVALDRGEEYGIWGGLLPHERNDMED